MVGRTVGHYEILEPLGAGGMGDVYRARDTNLDRDVALKMLPADFATDADRLARFEHEAKLLASLNHPNIAAIYGLEVADDLRFIAMELIEGETLEARMTEGRLPIEDALAIAASIAEALEAAHEAGIIHRDLKPANVMLARGDRVKLLDFGIATPISDSSAGDLTAVATALDPVTRSGTVPYMSPEQVRGHEQGRRADVWSWGCVVFEMLSGRRAFAGETAADTLGAVLEREPPWEALPDETPGSVRQLLRMTLEKRSERRPRDIRDLRLEIEEALVDRRSSATAAPAPRAEGLGPRPRLVVATAVLGLLLVLGFLAVRGRVDESASQRDPPAVPEPATANADSRVAVLPFANLRQDPETDFLGYALADEIISKLSLVGGLTVRPSSAVRRYEGQPLDVGAVADELQADVLLTGSYLKEGDDLRLNVELVDVEANESIWRDSLRVAYEDVFSLQDLVTEQVATGVRREFSSDSGLPEAHTPSSPLAYEYYLRSLGQPSTNEGHTEAIELLERSIQLGPDYPPARHQLGFRHYRLASFGFAGDEALRISEREYRAALELDPEYLPALSDLSAQLLEIGDVDEAVRLARRAVAINPTNAYSRFALAYAYRYAGLLEESEREWDTVLRLDPVNRRWRSAALTYICVGEWDKALAALDQDAESQYALAWKADIMIALGRHAEAREYLDRTLQIADQGLLANWAAALDAALRGEPDEGLARLAGNAGIPDIEYFFNEARVYCLLGDQEGCIESLRVAVDGGYANYRCALEHPSFEAVAENPEYQELVRTMERRHDRLEERLFVR